MPKFLGHCALMGSWRYFSTILVLGNGLKRVTSFTLWPRLPNPLGRILCGPRRVEEGSPHYCRDSNPGRPARSPLIYVERCPCSSVLAVGVYEHSVPEPRPPLWSSRQCSWLLTPRSQVRFPALPDFLSRSGSGTGSTQPL
jgi:hypothetical protein